MELAVIVPFYLRFVKISIESFVTRTIFAAITEDYQPDELIGRQALVVANLQPRKMRDIES